MGTVKFSALNIGHNTIIGGNGAYTQYALTQEGSFPSTPYRITSATLTYDVRTKDNGNIWNYFFVNRTNAPTAKLGTCNANGTTGVHVQDLTTENLYEGLTNIALVGDGGSACQIRSNTQIIITVNWELTQTNATAPTSITYSANPYDKELTISWSGASAGVNNPITSYKLRVWLGSNYTDYTTTATSYKLNTSSYASEQSLQAAVATVAQYNTTGYYTGSIVKKIKITSPTAPTNLGGTQPFTTSLTFSWTGQQDGSNNAISSYKIKYFSSSDGTSFNAGTEATATTNSYTISNPTATYYRYQVKSIGARGNESSYSAVSPTFSHNVRPPVPTITKPAKLGTTVYTKTPNISYTFGADADKQEQSMYVSIDDSLYSKVDNQLSLSIGAHKIRFAAFDGLEFSSPTAEYTITVNVSNLPSLAPSMVSANDINKMRTCINNIRDYCGIPTYEFSETIASDAIVKASHFTEMQEACSFSTTKFSKVNRNDFIQMSHYKEIYNSLTGGY